MAQQIRALSWTLHNLMAKDGRHNFFLVHPPELGLDLSPEGGALTSISVYVSLAEIENLQYSRRAKTVKIDYL